MQAVILCAGEGKRLQQKIPKGLVAIENTTLLHNTIITINRLDPQCHILVVSGYKHNLVCKEVESLQGNVSNYIQVIRNERYSEYGIVRSLLCTKSYITDHRVLRISGDIFFEHTNNLYDLSLQHQTTIAIGTPIPERGRTPIVMYDNDMQLIDIRLEEQPNSCEEEWIDFEIYCNNDYLKMLEQANQFESLGNYHFEMINHCLRDGMQIYCKHICGAIEIDTPKDLEYVKQLCGSSERVLE